MLRVALTGGIATGKSYVLGRLRRLGVPCLDADELAHGVTSAGTEASRAIGRRFGAEMLDESGAVDRRKLGPVVFADPAALRELEAIVQPAVYRAVIAGLRGFERVSGAPFVVAGLPLLYEKERQADYSHVIATLCAPGLQMSRLLERGLTEAAARQRLAAQLPAVEKARRADYIIHTDGTFEDTDAQIDDVRARLNAAAAPR